MCTSPCSCDLLRLYAFLCVVWLAARLVDGCALFIPFCSFQSPCPDGLRAVMLHCECHMLLMHRSAAVVSIHAVEAMATWLQRVATTAVPSPVLDEIMLRITFHKVLFNVKYGGPMQGKEIVALLDGLVEGVTGKEPVEMLLKTRAALMLFLITTKFIGTYTCSKSELYDSFVFKCFVFSFLPVKLDDALLACGARLSTVMDSVLSECARQGHVIPWKIMVRYENDVLSADLLVQVFA